jgi:hypothetical protein
MKCVEQDATARKHISFYYNSGQYVHTASSQSPTNALNISCIPYKTYNYIKYMKI